jgi:hypothetical protein
MVVGPEVRFKLTPEDYVYCKELAKFYYDHGVIPRPSVSSLAKRGIIRIATEWIEVQSIALKIRAKRQNVIGFLNVGDNNIPRSTMSSKNTRPQNTTYTTSKTSTT